MKTKEVAEAFCKGIRGIGNTLTSTGDKLVSYHTVIAQKVSINLALSNFILNATKYSVTSSTHLGYARRYLESHSIPYIMTTKQVPYNELDLTKYL